LLLIVALVGAVGAALLLAGTALLSALALNASYARSLGDRGRADRRMHGDRWVARYLGFGLLLPFSVCVGLRLCGYESSFHIWDFTASETSSLAIAGAALFVLVLLSSLVDWYYIRPRIDGVVCTPPCRSSGSDTWKRPTRRWFLHRGLVVLAYMGFAIVVALIVMLMLVRVDPAAAGVIGGISGIAGLLLIFAGRYREELPVVAQFVLSPAYCLGDDLSYELRKPKRGFVLHVAVPVTKLVPLDDHGRPTGADFVELKNSVLGEAEPEPHRTVACAVACAKLNPQCLADAPRRDRRRHRLVL
jgi:hypothetical protein